MKRLLVGGLVALGLAVTAVPAMADFCLTYNFCRNFSMVCTRKNRCFTYQSYCNPLPCCAPACCPTGPAMWNGLAAYGPYGYNPYGYAVAAQPAAAVAAPAAAAPSFQAPAPTPAAGVKQAVYSYGQTANPAYGYSSGYNYYGAGSGYNYYGYDAASYSYAQAPNYWY